MRQKCYSSVVTRCGNGSGSSPTFLRKLGLALMAIGALILLFCVPFRIWIALIGLLLVVLGFTLFRLG